MSRCRHPVATPYTLGVGGLEPQLDAVPPAEFHAINAATFGGRLVAMRCWDCRELLPLGPANDTPETAVEVEAARIASIGTLPPTRTDDENEGWEAHEWGEPTPGGHAAQAGWLARDIVVELMKEPDRD